MNDKPKLANTTKSNFEKPKGIAQIAAFVLTKAVEVDLIKTAVLHLSLLQQ